jgi:integrase
MVVEPICFPRARVATEVKIATDVQAAEQVANQCRLLRILKLDRLRLRGPTGARDEFLLAATAQNLRKSEIAALQWDWISGQDRTITLPGSITKNKRTHTFPIGYAAQAIIKSVPRSSDTYVFPAARDHMRGCARKARLTLRPFCLSEQRRSVIHATHGRAGLTPLGRQLRGRDCETICTLPRIRFYRVACSRLWRKGVG